MFCHKLINCYHNNLLTKFFEIKKIQELILQKSFWPILYYNVKGFIRDGDVCLAFKGICFKLYKILKWFLVFIHP